LAYHFKSSRGKLFFSTINYGSLGDKIFLSLNILGFIAAIYLHFTQSQAGLFLLAVCELGILYKLHNLKGSLVLNEYGAPDDSQAPHNDQNHKTSRYLMFKQELVNEHITKSHVEQCFELIDTQIEIIESNNIPIGNLSSLSAGLFLGVLGSFWRKLNTTELIYVGISFVIISLFIAFIISLFPSRIEKLKEMKYFMQLYCREVSL